MKSASPLVFASALSLANAAGYSVALAQAPPAMDAKTGFNDISIESGAATAGDPTNAAHLADKDTFDEVEVSAPNGLGPIYNAQSCRECHQSPVSGAASQITEHRAGHRDPHGLFQNPVVHIVGDTIVGRTLINDRATCASAQERVPEEDNIETNRLSLSILGDGYVEALDDKTILKFRTDQCSGKNNVKGICGFAIMVPILEAADKSQRIGRFGWKSQHASLMSFAADAYLNEMGVTNVLLPDEFTLVCNPPISETSSATAVTEPNDKPDSKTKTTDLDHFANFMRQTAAPPRDEAAMNLPSVVHGEKLFSDVGCGICHVSEMRTAPAGTVLNGGTFTVTAALGDKTIHPYSDFLLHNVGTGDGIVIAAPEHYGIALASYMSQLDDQKSSEEEASRLGVTKGRPKTPEFYHDKAQVQADTQVAEGDVKPIFDDQICNSASESEAALGGTSKNFSLGRQCSANKVRTPPLWGVRVRTRLMHDGASLRFEDAITRHRVEAEPVKRNFLALSKSDKDDLIAFLKSL